jgi:hypothetical protein
VLYLFLTEITTCFHLPIPCCWETIIL